FFLVAERSMGPGWVPPAVEGPAGFKLEVVGAGAWGARYGVWLRVLKLAGWLRVGSVRALYARRRLSSLLQRATSSCTLVGSSGAVTKSLSSWLFNPHLRCASKALSANR